MQLFGVGIPGTNRVDKQANLDALTDFFTKQLNELLFDFTFIPNIELQVDRLTRRADVFDELWKKAAILKNFHMIPRVHGAFGQPGKLAQTLAYLRQFGGVQVVLRSAA